MKRTEVKIGEEPQRRLGEGTQTEQILSLEKGRETKHQVNDLSGRYGIRKDFRDKEMVGW